MTSSTITIDPNGNGSITIGGQTHPLSAENVQAARSAAVRHATEYARAQGAPIELTAHEPTGMFRLSVGPDGKVTPLPAAPRHAAPAPAAEPPAPSEAPSAPTSADPAQAEGASWSHENDPAWKERAAQPATQGFRGTLNGIGLKLPPAAAELDERRTAYEREVIDAEEKRRAEVEAAAVAAEQETRRAARRREEEAAERQQRRLIQTNFQGAKTVLIANPKGGARKTTSTYLLAATLGIIRGGGVVAWDANETMGTLGARSAQDTHSRTVVDLLEQAASDFTSIERSRLGTLDRFVRTQGDAHFSVLASDEDATRQDIVDAQGFQKVHEILSRFTRMILVDTGNNIRASHFTAAVEAADQLVIPVAASQDSADVARQMMHSLIASGHEELVRGAVVLIHDLEPANSADADYLTVTRAIADDFGGKVAAVLPVPFDPALKSGQQIDYADLSPATQRAYREAAAALAASLRRRAE